MKWIVIIERSVTEDTDIVVDAESASEAVELALSIIPDLNPDEWYRTEVQAPTPARVFRARSSD
jgi:hypothetical protein